MLVFHTDGLIEGRAGPDAEARFGIEGLMGLVARTLQTPAARADLDVAVERMVTAVVAANGGPLPDDVTVVSVADTAGAPA